MDEAGFALNDPVVLMILAGVGGYFVREFVKGRDGITSARVTDADVLARLSAVEQWQRDNRTLHADFQRLTTIVENLATNVAKANEDFGRSFDRLTRRVDGWMASHPLTLERRVKSPYDFAEAAQWARDGQ